MLCKCGKVLHHKGKCYGSFPWNKGIKTIHKKICVFCGKSFEVDYLHRKKLTCSKECKQKKATIRPYKLKCKICDKQFECMFKNKTCSSKCANKLRSKSITEYFEKYPRSKNLEYVEKQRLLHLGKSWDKQLHEDTVKKEIKKLEKQGYKCTTLSPLPDFIAVKNNKIYAYEIEFWEPNYKKYDGITFYDDIIWILKNKRRRKTKE